MDAKRQSGQKKLNIKVKAGKSQHTFTEMAKNCITLLSGYQMPLIGLGTYKLQGYDALYTAIEAALKAGYRSFDTASGYKNETDIGKILKILLPKFNLIRENIFITSKLAPSEQGKDKAMAACLGSIDRLDCSYLDLYLIHWPGTQKLKPEDPRHKQFRKETWKDMEAAVENGRLRSIGVSNYLQHHLEELLSHCKVKPRVLQTEYHPHLIQKSLKQFCDEHAIHLQAYSSLGTSSQDNKLLTDSTVVKIATAIGKSPAHVLLRWAIQQDIGVIPKSSNPKHISENMEALTMTLSNEQMESLNVLDQQHHYCWDPALIA